MPRCPSSLPLSYPSPRRRQLQRLAPSPSRPSSCPSGSSCPATRPRPNPRHRIAPIPPFPFLSLLSFAQRPLQAPPPPLKPYGATATLPSFLPCSLFRKPPPPLCRTTCPTPSRPLPFLFLPPRTPAAATAAPRLPFVLPPSCFPSPHCSTLRTSSLPMLPHDPALPNPRRWHTRIPPAVATCVGQPRHQRSSCVPTHRHRC
ncbi:hypothetical protein SETIT_9G317800v2 [Setaria italica]|uniref:Uncharacterized protein n=1 Tax=Setaria italica TaxID=4555 RepID=A0A368SN13_SETIT|nr:hypothetical protein SETIT_9G317800v2 [Setaria italica]